MSLFSRYSGILFGSIVISDEAFRLPVKKVSVAYSVCKRIVDVVGAILLLIVSLPLWALTSLIILISSPGPIFVSQKRVGKDGKEFVMWKFRTMHYAAKLYAHPPKAPGDPRVTDIGKWLRITSLDELPQLVNVLRGDMSLVGPRPEMPFIVEAYTEVQKRRLEVEPGLTGLWQVLGRKDLPLKDHLYFDFYYMAYRTIVLDFVIMLRTVVVIFFRRGAY